MQYKQPAFSCFCKANKLYLLQSTSHTAQNVQQTQFSVYRVWHKKQPPKKNSISRKPCNLNSWNLHHIILRNTTVFSEKFLSYHPHETEVTAVWTEKGQFCNWTISTAVTVIQKIRIKLSFRYPCLVGLRIYLLL